MSLTALPSPTKLYVHSLQYPGSYVVKLIIFFPVVQIGEDDGFLYLMNDKGEPSENTKIPEGELGDLIRQNLPQVEASPPTAMISKYRALAF